jgi:hypothetical protein
MTDLSAYRHLEALDLAGLYARYDDLKRGLTLLPNGMPDPREVKDDLILQEMAFIMGQLRRRSAGPPKVARRPGVSVPKTAPTVDQL